MNLQFQKFQGEVDHLVSFLTSQSWDYHSDPRPGADQIRQLAKKRLLPQPGKHHFQDSVGLQGEDRPVKSEDSTPLFDIRVLNLYRKRGIGETAVRWMARYVFTRFPHTIRIEGHTRRDACGVG